jgi:hypothetical protein
MDAPIAQQRGMKISGQFLSQSGRVAIAQMLRAHRKTRSYSHRPWQTSTSKQADPPEHYCLLATTVRRRLSLVPSVDGAVLGPGG